MDDGAWLLRDDTFVKGKGDQPPARDAIWCGFHAAAYRVLELYSSGKIGFVKLARQMRREGWTFRNRNGDPVPFDAGAVRRIIANWPEYGGNISALRAKERHPYRHAIENYNLNRDRAIFPLELLYQVGRVRYARTRDPAVDIGLNADTDPYPLLGVIFCHHCDLAAERLNDPSRRTRLGGKNKNASGRYRHKPDVACDCKSRSIKREIVEAQIGRLVERIVLRPELVPSISAIRASSNSHSTTERMTQFAELRIGIAKCNRRIEAARFLFQDGDIDQAEYVRRKTINEQEIATSESRLAEDTATLLPIEMWVELLARMQLVWKSAGDEDRQALVRSIFQEIVVDLDAQRITRVKLQRWAEMLVLIGD